MYFFISIWREPKRLLRSLLEMRSIFESGFERTRFRSLKNVTALGSKTPRSDIFYRRVLDVFQRFFIENILLADGAYLIANIIKISQHNRTLCRYSLCFVSFIHTQLVSGVFLHHHDCGRNCFYENRHVHCFRHFCCHRWSCWSESLW